MSQHPIREFDGKNLIEKWFMARHKAQNIPHIPFICANVNPATSLETMHEQLPWLLENKLVIKPDQLIKRRGKAGLLKLNTTWADAKQWISEKRGRVQQVGNVAGVLDTFIVEPFVTHEQVEEYYVCIVTKAEGDEILFTRDGGINVGDVDAKATRLSIPIQVDPSTITPAKIGDALLAHIPEERKVVLSKFIADLYNCFVDLHFTYLEINPVVVTSDMRVHVLDLAAKLDECGKHEVGNRWGNLTFPPAFGRMKTVEEAYVAKLDSLSGASLKLTVLNEKARIWTMVAGGGASVIYADTLCDLGAGAEMANYGEYSGDPSETLTYEYAKTILKLATKHKDPRGKLLLIGGGIANFTNVAETFKGIIRALSEYREQLIEHKVKIYVRRGGPNYQEGLLRMRALGKTLGVPMFVFGPESHLTTIVALALDKPIDPALECVPTPFPVAETSTGAVVAESTQVATDTTVEVISGPGAPLYTSKTRSFIYGLQLGAAQNMLDFDFVSGRKTPSVAAIVYEFTPSHQRKFYFGSKEFMIPVYDSLAKAIEACPDVSTIVSFASSRSIYKSTLEMLKYPKQITSITLIAEGVPERRTRQINYLAKQAGVLIIGPATVGGVVPGCFRIGNAGGSLDNIVESHLHRAGSVAYVSRSGGLSNELNNIIGLQTDGVYEGIAIGGDRFPGSQFIDHAIRYEQNPAVKMIVVLGEVGGTGEYAICEAMKYGKITKPVVAWCTGTVAKIFPYNVQFGHAGAMANSQSETADAKNAALRAAGAIVPTSFQDFHVCVRNTYLKLVTEGKIIPHVEVPAPKVPVEYEWARKLGMVRKSSNFVSSISDERGEELTYASVPISEVISKQMGVGGVIGLLWFGKKLPEYASRFIEMVLMVTADHGPAVSGAHNTIVAARAGKDLVSSLCSGLLTIGPKFGGALDDAALKFSGAFDSKLTPDEFVNLMQKQKELIPGIGHKKKSISNPDKRVSVVVNYVKANFPKTELLDYALATEKITTQKKGSLILNVDGAVAVAFVDLLRGSGIFTRAEADEYIAMGCLNGLFVLGRSAGFIGHYIDQKRLKQGLYRHPTDDIAYISMNANKPQSRSFSTIAYKPNFSLPTRAIAFKSNLALPSAACAIPSLLGSSRFLKTVFRLL